MRALLLVVVPCSWFCSAEACADDKPASVEDTRRIAQLLLDYRRARTSAERRTKAVLELAAISNAVAARLAGTIEEEIKLFSDGLGKQLQKAKPKPELQQEIDRHRKILADLRADPQLTKDKVKLHGKAALDRLNALYPLLAKHRTTVRVQTERFLARYEPLRKSCAQLKAKWAGKKEPLPVSRYLQQMETLRAKAAPSAEQQRAAAVLTKNAELGRKMPRNVTNGVTMLNQMRVMMGLSPIEIDPKLCLAAIGHSQDMDRLNFFAHISPVRGKRTFGDRARRAGTSASGENIFAGSTSGKKAIEAWFYSPGHHKIMLGKFRRIGLGNWKRHWTMLVGR